MTEPLQFRYRALDSSGRQRAGTLTAASTEAATLALGAQQLVPFELKPLATLDREPWWRRDLFSRGQSPRDLASYLRQLATLFDAGLSIDQTLHLLAQGGTTQQMAASRKLLDCVRSGRSLHQAFIDCSVALPTDMLAILRAGEASGALDAALLDIAQTLENQVEIAAQIRSALVYPIFLCAMALGSVVLIVTVLIPTVRPIMQDAGVELPFILHALLAMQNVLTDHWLVVVLVAAGLLSMLPMGRRNRALQLLWSKQRLRIPVLGPISRDLACARLFRTLAVLLKSGVPLVQSLNLAAGAVGNPALEPLVVTAARHVQEGTSLGEALRRGCFIPEMWLRLVRVGDETGRLDAMLLHSARMLDTETKSRINNLLVLLTPVLTVCIGGAVGWLVLSVMSAVLSVNELAIR